MSRAACLTSDIAHPTFPKPSLTLGLLVSVRTPLTIT